MRNQVNQFNLTVYAGSFILYNLSVVVLYMSYFVYLKLEARFGANSTPQITRYTLLAWIFTTYTGFIA
jgi:hypothetical protein